MADCDLRGLETGDVALSTQTGRDGTSRGALNFSIATLRFWISRQSRNRGNIGRGLQPHPCQPRASVINSKPEDGKKDGSLDQVDGPAQTSRIEHPCRQPK